METQKTILIVDDDSFLLDMYALKFSKYNYNVATALGSEFALEKLQSGFVPDIMLLDIIMPVMDGFEFLEKVKEENLAQDTTIIFLSNRGQPSDIARGEALGAAGYIIKASSTPLEVIEKVSSIIKEKEKK